MSNRFSLLQRLRFTFDNFMARGTPAQLMALGLLTLLLVLLFSGLLYFLRLYPASTGEHPGPGNVLWDTMIGVLKFGKQRWLPGAAGYMAVRLLIFLAAMFVASILISMLTSGFRNGVNNLSRGRSRVPLTGHTVVLGWSSALPNILDELQQGHKDRRRHFVVVLADRDKVKMDEEVRKVDARVPSVRILTRRGSPADAADLRLVNVDGARSVIVLSAEGQKDADIEAAKVLMAIVNAPDARPERYHLVVALEKMRNLEVLRLAARGNVEVLPSLDILAKITAQTCRQPGLPVVYTELMRFRGSEFYFIRDEDAVGRTFEELLFSYPRAVPLGLERGDELLINPPGDQIMEPDDRLVVLAARRDARSGERVTPATAEITEHQVGTLEPEHIVVVGWNGRGPVILRELSGYASPGSTVSVLVGRPPEAERVEAVAKDLDSLTVTCRVGDPTRREHLERVDLDGANHVIVLRHDGMAPRQSDARVMVTLLYVRDILERAGRDIPLVSELVLEQNRRIAEAGRADDFIVGSRIIALLYSQVSRTRALNGFFSALLSEQGQEIYLKPVEAYVTPGAELDFYQVTEAARRKGELAMGYRRLALASQGDKNYGVVLNPDKTARLSFEPGDRIIVLAEEYFR